LFNYCRQIENTDEVELVKVILDVIKEVLHELGTQQWTIGVITPYSAQKYSILNAIKK